MAPLLDCQFATTLEMTDNTLGVQKVNVDTRKFRNAIWFYIHRITGILHDDYNYAEVNKLLERDLKQFLKKVTCYPENITTADFDTFGADLRSAEKCHLNLLALESRKQAEILHAVHAVMEFMEG